MFTTALLSLALAAEPIRLSPGTQHVLKVGNVTKVAIGQDSIADVRPTGRGELLLTGNQVGRTSLTIWTTQGMQSRTVIVDDGRTEGTRGLVQQLINPSLKVAEYNGMTVIDGTLDSMDELRRLQALVGSDPNVKILATVDPRVMPALAQNINAALQKHGLANAHAIAIGQKIILEGSVADERELQKALLIANTYADAVTSNLR